MSRFVSAGTTEDPVEHDDEWAKAQAELETARQRKKQEAEAHGGKSLYEILQANKGATSPSLRSPLTLLKAAKQEAFEEKAKLQNQFRSLDADEVDFLDSVLDKQREEEAKMKKETREQLELFKRQQEEAERAAAAGSPDEATGDRADSWTAAAGRKRKKGRGKEGVLGLKLRKASSVGEQEQEDAEEAVKKGKSIEAVEAASQAKAKVVSAARPPPLSKSPEATSRELKAASPSTGLGLGGYSSEEDD